MKRLLILLAVILASLAGGMLSGTIAGQHQVAQPSTPLPPTIEQILEPFTSLLPAILADDLSHCGNHPYAEAVIVATFHPCEALGKGWTAVRLEQSPMPGLNICYCDKEP